VRELRLPSLSHPVVTSFLHTMVCHEPKFLNLLDSKHLVTTTIKKAFYECPGSVLCSAHQSAIDSPLRSDGELAR
jgi:hypothetical protein